MIFSAGFVTAPSAHAAGTFAASTSQAIAGETITFTGSLPPGKSRPASLQFQEGSTWVDLASGITLFDGTFEFTTQARDKDTTYRVQGPEVVDSDLPEETTSTVQVVTLPQSGTLSLATKAEIGAKVDARATFSPVRENRPVELQVKDGSNWKKVASGRQDATGSATFSIPTNKAGKFSYQVVAKAHNGASPVTTSSKSIEITKPSCFGQVDNRSTKAAKAKPFTVCGIPVVSKTHRVTSAYKPKLTKVKLPLWGIKSARLQPDAASALKKLFKAADKAGYKLNIRYAYRSYATQQSIYKTGSGLAAPPGASEHQTGLAVDLAWKSKKGIVRGYQFGSSKAGKWVRANAHKYGFIIRYPNGQQKITGIPYEPWHIRYVGKTAASGVMKTKSKTLEEYLRIS